MLSYFVDPAKQLSSINAGRSDILAAHPEK
jgi:hypothetical protein